MTDIVNDIKAKAISILIISDDNSKEQLRYLNAALEIIKETRLENLTFKFTMHPSSDYSINQFNNTENFDWFFYLSSAPIPEPVLDKIGRGTKLIADARYSQNENATNLVYWNELAIQLQFPQILLSFLLADSIQNYQMQQRLTLEQINGDKAADERNRSQLLPFAEQFKDPLVDKLLILLLVLFWSIERILSEVKKSRQKIITKNTSRVSIAKTIESNR